jgi:hypothetical protein
MKHKNDSAIIKKIKYEDNNWLKNNVMVLEDFLVFLFLIKFHA